jgi:hypothetical protein
VVWLSAISPGCELLMPGMVWKGIGEPASTQLSDVQYNMLNEQSRHQLVICGSQPNHEILIW